MRLSILSRNQRDGIQNIINFSFSVVLRVDDQSYKIYNDPTLKGGRMVPVLILTIGILSRIVLHIPNFSPVYALALFSGAYLDKRLSLVLPVILLMVTDLVLGVYPDAPFTWMGMASIAAFGWILRERKGIWNVLGVSVLASVVFFVISNFGVWIMGGLYSVDLKGLTDCFVMAIPFFKHTLISTVVYSVILIMGFEKFLKVRSSWSVVRS